MLTFMEYIISIILFCRITWAYISRPVGGDDKLPAAVGIVYFRVVWSSVFGDGHVFTVVIYV